MFNNIKQNIGKYFFHKEMKRHIRERSVFNIDLAKYIGILYKIDSENTQKDVCNFFKYLEKKNKTISVLGYINDKEKFQITKEINGFNYFSFNDLNWYKKPSNDICEAFINQPFDLLINLNKDECHPIHYISGLSKAKFKVGRYQKEFEEVFDLMINIDHKTEISIFIEQIKHYLKIINNAA